MMKHEFEEMYENLTGIELEVEKGEYEVIEFVYMWHPTFDRDDSKRVAVELYKLLGLVPFQAMMKDATEAYNLEQTVSKLKSELEKAKDALNNFKQQFK